MNKEKEVVTSKEGKSWRTEVQNEVLYRVFEPNQDGSGTVKQYRRDVMKLHMRT